MPPHSVPVDKDGFPLPRKVGEEPAPRKERKLGPTPPWARAAAGMLLVGVIAALAAVPAWKRGGGPAMVRARCDQAYARFQDGDLPGALQLLDKAQAAAPQDARVAIYRGWLRLEAGDLAGSLHDLNRAQQSHPHTQEVYSLRSRVYQRLGRHREAINDATEAIATSVNGDPEPYNERAYVRAVAGVELTDALDDVQRAIDLARRPVAAYLDTRGYLYHLLDRQAEALADLDRAIALTEAEGPRSLQHRGFGQGVASELDLRRYRENLSVLYHHRGLVQQSLGNEDLSQRDFERGKELGYNPSAGVF
jgi:tetratricopeptide (TPR) repeat protein